MALSYQELNSFHFPSETTSTAPSITVIAVASSIAYVGTGSLLGPFLRVRHVLLIVEFDVRNNREVNQSRAVSHDQGHGGFPRGRAEHHLFR